MPHRVLLVEDSPAMRSYVAAALESDYDITTVESGFQALQALPQGRYDLVISDVHMPDINGLELCAPAEASWNAPLLRLCFARSWRRD